MIRSAFAVLAGYGFLAVATAAKYFAIRRFAPGVLPAAGEDVFPNVGSLLAMLGSDVGLMIASGYLTAVVAERSPIAHAIVLGAAMVVLGLVWVFVFWGWLPVWYQVVLVSIAIPAAATGGSLRLQRRAESGR
jgi:hypothetical protein